LQYTNFNSFNSTDKE
jgi:hypothetical protein